MYKITEKKIILVENGNVRHGLKSTDESFISFGELYFTEIKKNSVKGWKRHKKMTLNLLPVVGEIELYLKRGLEDYPEKVSFSFDDYKLISIEPNVWVAFKGLADFNLMANVASIEHDPNEAESIPYVE